MKVTRAVGFMKPHVGLIFFVIENLFTITIYYHKSCYTKHTFSPAGKPDKNHYYKEDENKYLIGESLDKFNRTLSLRIIRNKEGFLLHHILGAELTFTETLV